MAASAKDKLLETALALFYRDGFHATGIDRILAEAGVSKMTLYKYFPSKEDLILGVLELRDRRFRDWMETRVAQLAQAPAERLLAVFDAASEWFAQDGFHGCLFINATAEFGDAASPVRRAAAHHKALMADWLARIAEAAGARDAHGLAQTLMLVLEGAVVTAQVSGGDAAGTARAVAAQLVSKAFA